MGGNAIVHTRELAGQQLVDYRGGHASGLGGSDDSLDFAAVLDNAGADRSVQPTHSCDTLVVSPRFSAASATVNVTCALWLWDSVAETPAFVFLGIAGTEEATGHATAQDENNRYPGTEMLAFALDGATHYELRVDTLSSGTVQLVPLLVGPDPKAGPSSVGA